MIRGTLTGDRAPTQQITCDTCLNIDSLSVDRSVTSAIARSMSAMSRLLLEKINEKRQITEQERSLTAELETRESTRNF